MKKLLTLLVVAVGLLFAASCGRNETPAQVAEKIAQGQTLTQDDYTVMIEYCGAYAKKAQALQNTIDNLPTDDPKAVKATDDILALQESNEYLTPFFDVITKSTKEQVGDKNVILINDYAAYEWFLSPDWAVIVTNPDVAGIVVDDSGADSAVIATPTGTVVE